MDTNLLRVKWQLPMKRVLYALVPIALSAVYFYGWRVLLVIAVSNLTAYFAECAFTYRWKQKVSSAVFVTGTLFAMSLPPSLPLWMVVLGAAFAIVFGKMVFGGFGKNVFNPALTGRAFIYISFGGYMTSRWNEPVSGPLGGWMAYSSDAITQATPGMVMKTGEHVAWMKLFLGNTSGVIGGTSALLVILGAIYLLRTKTANYRIVASGFAGFLVAHTLLFLAGVERAGNPLYAVFAGSAVIGIVFYATDPVSAPKTNTARWLYGSFIGAMSSVITVFSAWPAGTMFAILLANMFAPITDHAVRAMEKRRKAKRAAA